MLAKIGLAAVLVLAQGLCAANERAEREEITNTVTTAYFKRDYAAIEAWLEQAKQKPLTTAGTHKLDVVLRLFDQIIPAPVNQPYHEAFWTATQAKIDDWRRAFPKSSMAAYAGSQLPLLQAFNVRRHKPTTTMTTADWDAFDASVQKAVDVLQEARDQVVQDEVWQIAVLKVARYQRMDTADYQRLVQAAAARFPDHRPLYAAAVARLRPQGGGSAEALDWLAQLAQENSQGRSGMAPYAAVYADASRFSDPEGLFQATLLDWKKMKAGLDDVVGRFPDTYNLSLYASFACMARDQQALKALLSRLGDNIDRTLWADGRRLSICKGFADAPASGPGSEHLYTWELFQALIRDGDWKRIEDTYGQLLKSGDRSSDGRSLAHSFADFTAHRCMPVRAERETPQKGQAVSDACRQRFEARLAAWRSAYPASALPVIGMSESALVEAGALAPSQLKAKDEALDRAQAALDTVKAESRSMAWYLQAMRVATRQGWGKSRFMQLLREGAMRYPDQAELYRRAVQHFLPANAGTPADMDAVARLAIARNDVATGLMLYAKTYEEVIFGAGNYWGAAYSETLVAWPEMRAGLTEFNRRYPNAWNHNRLAHHACLAGDNDALRDLLARSATFEPQLRSHGWSERELARCRRRLEPRETEQTPPPEKTRAIDRVKALEERTS